MTEEEQGGTTPEPGAVATVADQAPEDTVAATAVDEPATIADEPTTASEASTPESTDNEVSAPAEAATAEAVTTGTGRNGAQDETAPDGRNRADGPRRPPRRPTTAGDRAPASPLR